jgi:hypothetical protein
MMVPDYPKSYKPKVKPVKLICGVLFNRDFDIKKAEDKLISLLGPFDFNSPIFDFVFTNYYSSEMGDNLAKCFYSFERLIMPDALPDIKNAAIEVEK